MQKIRKTKIVATVGPGSNNLATLEQLITKGVNVFRLNFSHGSHEEHSDNLSLIREAETNVGIPVGVLQDLSGPKMRITELAEDADPQLQRGQEVKLRYGKEKSSGDTLYLSVIDPRKFAKPGDHILMADGNITLNVLENHPDYVLCSAFKPAKLRSRIGIAFPDSHIDLPATTQKDLDDLEWGVANRVDFIAVSFVQKAADLDPVINRIADMPLTERPLVVSKIEMKAALDNIAEIIEKTDAIMVARGDLGVELPVEKVPVVQRRLIRLANSVGKPVIVATQMLHSMVHANRPTRAEVTDVSTAVMSGTDAVMLSEETAIGDYPVESVDYLSRIAFEAEQEFDFELFKSRFKENQDKADVSDAIAYAACAAANRLNAAALITCTETGFSSKLVAKYRPQIPLYGITAHKSSQRRMCMFWGVTPIEAADGGSSHQQEIESALDQVREKEGLESKDIAVITGGLKVRVPGATSVLEIRNF